MIIVTVISLLLNLKSSHKVRIIEHVETGYVSFSEWWIGLFVRRTPIVILTVASVCEMKRMILHSDSIFAILLYLSLLSMPIPSIPDLRLIPYVIQEAVSISIVAFAVTVSSLFRSHFLALQLQVSMGKLFCKKHKYSIDTNQVSFCIIIERRRCSIQELLALGLGGSISSFFSVFPCSTSLSRSLVNEAAGAMTQVGLSRCRIRFFITRGLCHSDLWVWGEWRDGFFILSWTTCINPPLSTEPSSFQMSGLFSSFIVLLVILWIGPLLSSLPLCVLSSIVVVALRSLFMKVRTNRNHSSKFITMLVDQYNHCRCPNCPISGAFPRLIS